MKSLQEILKENGQNPNLANQTGKLGFCKKARGLVYSPPAFNNSEKQKGFKRKK